MVFLQKARKTDQDRMPTLFTSGSRTSETGGQIFSKIVERLYFWSFPKKFLHFPPKKFHLSPKISDDLFLVIVINLSRVLDMVFFQRAGQIRSRHQYGGGAKSLLSNTITILPLLFL